MNDPIFILNPHFKFVSPQFFFVGPTEPLNLIGVHNPDYPNVIMVMWDEPRLVTDKLDRYELHYRQEGEKAWYTRLLPGSVQAYNITNFDLGKNYEVYIVAVDSNGPGKKSLTDIVTTQRGWTCY